MAEVTFKAYVALMDDNHKLRAQRDALKSEVVALKELLKEFYDYLPIEDSELSRRAEYAILGEVP